MSNVFDNSWETVVFVTMTVSMTLSVSESMSVRDISYAVIAITEEDTKGKGGPKDDLIFFQ